MAVLVLVLALLPNTANAAPATAAAGGRYFQQTGFRLINPAFLDFFDHRGGLRTFGYPVSREFTFQGFRVQFFQRGVMQLRYDGTVTTMNILDPGLMPYTQINSAAFPGPNASLTKSAPAPGAPGYSKAILAYVQANASNTWQTLGVGFYRTFSSAVTAADVYPGGKGAPGLLPGFDLELWGIPTSQPAADPKNANFVYQRFQRGIMHYDKSTGTTQGLLLADYLKSIITGQNLPPDLEGQAQNSPFYRQYDASQPKWLARPGSLPGTDLTMAFEREPIIVIDPGHGGSETGSSFKFADGTVLREKELTLQVASRTTALLRAAGYQVIQTRTTDAAVNLPGRDITSDGHVDLRDELQARVDLANNARATLILSIHFNGIGDQNTRGTEVYYCRARPFASQSKRFATLVQQSLVTSLDGARYDTVDRGIKDDPLSVGKGSHLYLLGPDSVRPATMPGALGEGLFLTNPTEAAKLRDPGLLDALAQGYAKAVRAYYEGP